MFQIDNIIERQTLVAKVQRGIIIVLSLLCVLLWWGWLQAPKHLDRTREMHSMLNGADVVAAVKRLTAHSWEVDVDMEVIERTDDMVVKQRHIRYPLRVVRYAISREVNPYGLAVAGFVGEPERLKKPVAR